jgi:hypothetical protein
VAPEDFFEFVPEIGMCRGGLAVLECRFLLFFVFVTGFLAVELVYKWAFSFPLNIFFV